MAAQPSTQLPSYHKVEGSNPSRSLEPVKKIAFCDSWLCVCVRVCVCVRERERECDVCVCVMCVCVCVCDVLIIF
jgi:hypothetical protein